MRWLGHEENEQWGRTLGVWKAVVAEKGFDAVHLKVQCLVDEMV